MILPRMGMAALCICGPLACAAQAASIHGEATYTSFSVPGALGTYPTGINASMEVTGYYGISTTQQGGFVREADGTITTFQIEGGLRTTPLSINAAGDITGSWTPAAGQPQGFIRYAGGRIVTIPATGDETVYPVAINDFDEVAMNYFNDGIKSMIRSRTGQLTALTVPGVATAINASGSIIGILYSNNGFTGFVAHPDGYWTPVGPAVVSPCADQTIPDAINAAGVIAGTFTRNYPFDPSCPENTGGFVMAPGGTFTLFQPPGQMPYYHDLLLSPSNYPLHLVSIDQAGDIAGSYIDKAGVLHGFVRNPYGTISSFDPPKSQSTTVTSMSDGGAIAGYYHFDSSGNGPVHGFIRVP